MSRYEQSKIWSTMKKEVLVRELEKNQNMLEIQDKRLAIQDERLEKMDHTLRIAMTEIQGLEVTNASARMFLASLLEMALIEKEVDEIYIDKLYAYGLLETTYVDFKPADDANVGVFLKLVTNAIKPLDVDIK